MFFHSLSIPFQSVGPDCGRLHLEPFLAIFADCWVVFSEDGFCNGSGRGLCFIIDLLAGFAVNINLLTIGIKNPCSVILAAILYYFTVLRNNFFLSHNNPPMMKGMVVSAIHPRLLLRDSIVPLFEDMLKHGSNIFRSVILCLRVYIHCDLAVLVPRKILHRLRINRSVNQVCDVSMP